MNNHALRAVGALEEVTSVDILCGKSKKCFNHSGNRRFRFLVSFNLDRYKEAKSRKEKSSVVASVLRQIRNAGGRFLVLNADEKVVLASEKVAKEKISHALRDKTPFEGMKVARERLRIRLGEDASPCEHYHYLVANERLLRVDLPSDQHAADDKFERILAEEIELLSYHRDAPVAGGATSIAFNKQPQFSASSSVEDPRQIKPPNVQEGLPRKIGDVINGRSNVFGHSRPQSRSVWGELFTREMIDEANTSSSWRTETEFEPSLVMSDGQSENDLLEEEEDVIADWNLSEDLPHNFTEDDCENLVAMLDYASSL